MEDVCGQKVYGKGPPEQGELKGHLKTLGDESSMVHKI